MFRTLFGTCREEEAHRERYIEISGAAHSGADICDFGNSVDVYTYTEQGDPLQSTSYDADGNSTSDLRYEYEGDTDRNNLPAKYYADGVLMDETVYEAGAPVQYTAYYEDCTKIVVEYHENGKFNRCLPVTF